MEAEMSTVLWLALIWLSAAAGFFAAALMNAARNADEEYETNTRAKEGESDAADSTPDMSQLSAAPFHPRIVSRVGKTVGSRLARRQALAGKPVAQLPAHKHRRCL
jgi:hypothetical protein